MSAGQWTHPQKGQKFLAENQHGLGSCETWLTALKSKYLVRASTRSQSVKE